MVSGTELSSQWEKVMSKITEIKYWYITRPAEKMRIKLAWAMPKWLVYWCAIRLVAHATSGEYGSTIVPELTAMDALKRWGAP